MAVQLLALVDREHGDRGTARSRREPPPEHTHPPAAAANPASAVPPAAAGNRSSSSSIASALSLQGALKSSANAPPTAPESTTTRAARTAHAPIVRQGLRALTSPMRRTRRFMPCEAAETVLVPAARSVVLMLFSLPRLRGSYRARRLMPRARRSRGA